jgi:hypothetical protein
MPSVSARSCVHVLSDISELYDALILEEALDAPPDMVSDLEKAQKKANARRGADGKVDE